MFKQHFKWFGQTIEFKNAKKNKSRNTAHTRNSNNEKKLGKTKAATANGKIRENALVLSDKHRTHDKTMCTMYIQYIDTSIYAMNAFYENSLSLLAIVVSTAGFDCFICTEPSIASDSCTLIFRWTIPYIMHGILLYTNEDLLAERRT